MNENYTQSPIKSNNSSSVMKGALAIAILLAIGAGFAYVGSFYFMPGRDTDTSSFNNDGLLYDTAFAALENVGINTDLSRVQAVANTARGLESLDFRKTADPSFYAARADEALRNDDLELWAEAQIELATAYIAYDGGGKAEEASNALKSVVANRELLQETRAKAMRDLATLYCMSGLDKRVFEAIFTGPYAQFYKEKNPMLAGRRMLEVSYEMHPRARTAVSVAHMYIDPIVNMDLTAQEKADARDSGLTFLRNGEVLARDEFNPNEISQSYASYLFWQAVSYGQLAMEYPEYVDDAEQAYENMFAYYDRFKGTFNTTVTDMIPFAHLRYVNFLTEVYGDDASDRITQHLDTLVQLVTEDTNPEVNIFLKYLDNKRKDLEETGTYTHWLRDAREYSTQYDAFLTENGLPQITG